MSWLSKVDDAIKRMGQRLVGQQKQPPARPPTPPTQPPVITPQPAAGLPGGGGMHWQVRLGLWEWRYRWLVAALQGALVTAIVLVAFSIFVIATHLSLWLPALLFLPSMIIGAVWGITAQLKETEYGFRRGIEVLGHLLPVFAGVGTEPYPWPLESVDGADLVSVLKRSSAINEVVPTGPPRTTLTPDSQQDPSSPLNEVQLERSEIRGRLEMRVEGTYAFKVIDETDEGVTPAQAFDALWSYQHFADLNPNEPETQTPEQMLDRAIKRLVRQTVSGLDPFEAMGWHGQLETRVQNHALATSDYLQRIFRVVGVEISNITPADEKSKEAIFRGAEAYQFAKATEKRQEMIIAIADRVKRNDNLKNINAEKLYKMLELDALNNPELLKEQVTSFSLLGDDALAEVIRAIVGSRAEPTNQEQLLREILAEVKRRPRKPGRR